MQVPREDHALWGAWIQTVVATSRNVEPTPEVRRAVVEAHVGFLEYFRALVARRRENLGADLVSELIRAEDEGDQLSELELLGTLQMLIAAGSETTSNLIGNAMLCLLHHPEQAQKLREDLSLMPGAIEEFLRLGTPSDWALPRVALEDIDLGDGHVVEKGSVVLLSIGSANRDAGLPRPRASRHHPLREPSHQLRRRPALLPRRPARSSRSQRDDRHDPHSMAHARACRGAHLPPDVREGAEGAPRAGALIPCTTRPLRPAG